MSNTAYDFWSIMKLLESYVVAVFRDQDDEPWVAIQRNGSIRNLALYSQDFKDLVMYASMASPLNRLGDFGFSMPAGDKVVKAVQNAFRLGSAREKKTLFLRYGWDRQKLLVDLGDSNHTVIEVDELGWRKTSGGIPPFFRAKDQAPFPDPDASGDFREITRFLPFQNEDDRIIALIYTASLPFLQYERPILVIYGPASSGKSKVTHVLRDIADPQTKPPGDMPTDRKSLIINLAESYLPAFDNANETVSASFQSAFSGSVTGFTHKERRLFSNFGLACVSFRRASIVNGLAVPFTKPDLLSRCLLIKTQKISREIDPSALREEFEKRRSAIWGGMLNTISRALKILPDVRPIPDDLARFRDWARVGIAIGIALGIPRERFLEILAVLKKRQRSLVATIVPVCGAIIKLMEHPDEWKVRNKEMTRQMWVGTATELLGELESVAQRHRIDLSGFPKGSAQLGMSLEGIANELQTWNITLRRDEERTGKNRDRYIRIFKGSVGRQSYHESDLPLLEK